MTYCAPRGPTFKMPKTDPLTRVRVRIDPEKFSYTYAYAYA